MKTLLNWLAGLSSQSGEWATVWRQFAARRVNRGAMALVLVLVVVATFADFLASDLPVFLRLHGRVYWFPNLISYGELRVYDCQMLSTSLRSGDFAIVPLVPWGYNSHDLTQVLSAPSWAHWLGTDSSGRDVLARIVHGTRVSLFVGALSVIVLVVVGVGLGTIAGYFGKALDVVLMRIVEVVHSIPTVLLLVTILSVIAPQGYLAVLTMTVVIGLVRWTDVARLVRGEILRVKALDFVQAARAQGASDSRIIFRHVLPNAINPVLVSATFALASAILIEGALSFLGFGIPDDMASWGGLLNEVRGNIEAWWLAIFPGTAIFVTVTAFNVLGEGVRDATDPRLRE
ncbi:MAG: ABC transporter permease [Polyangiaceae bacterium]